MLAAEKMRKIITEILLILLISLFLSLIYNAVSPAGIRILPKKPATNAELIKGGVIIRSAAEGAVRRPHTSNGSYKGHT